MSGQSSLFQNALHQSRRFRPQRLRKGAYNILSATVPLLIPQIIFLSPFYLPQVYLHLLTALFLFFPNSRLTAPAAISTPGQPAAAFECRSPNRCRYLKNAAALKLATGPYKVHARISDFAPRLSRSFPSCCCLVAACCCLTHRRLHVTLTSLPPPHTPRTCTSKRSQEARRR